MDEQLAQTLVTTAKGMKDSLKKLKVLDSILAKLGHIEGLMERVVASNESLANSNNQLAQMMEKSMAAYEQMSKEPIIQEATVTTKRQS